MTAVAQGKSTVALALQYAMTPYSLFSSIAVVATLDHSANLASMRRNRRI